jgi:acyl-CoA reductase-like NAD-dependent aldehyde dehydrogenase
MRDETFGPTLPVMKVRDEAEAIALANDSAYGLAGSVWTADPARAERIATRLETGGVCVNNALVGAFQLPLPFGGWKTSGVGYRSGGRHALVKYCRQQAFVAERVHLPKEPNWYPYTPARAKLVAAAIRLVGMRDWRRRLGLGTRGR